jgi:hypothetical protein
MLQRTTRDVSRLKRLDPCLLARVRQELLDPNVPWQQNYSEYQSNGWHTVSLLNDTGRSVDTTIRDVVPQPTDLLLSLPSTRHLIESLNLQLFWARAAKLEPNSYVWEHVDYLELANKDRVRLHIPVLTNERARLVLERSSVFMAGDFLWKLDPQAVHGAANEGHACRIHLILDCLWDPKIMSALIANEDLPRSYVRKLPTLSDTTLTRVTSRARSLIRLGYHRPAHHLLLRLFHAYSLPPGFTLAQVIELYAKLGMAEHQQEWEERRSRFMGTGLPQ